MLLNTKNIYLDHNATTPVSLSVKEAMFDIMEMPLNPSSVHADGKKAKSIIERARKDIMHCLGDMDDEYQLVFTATGTESNNIALKGLEGYRVAVSEIEHAAVFRIVGYGHIPVHKNGKVDLNAIERISKSLEGEKFIVSVMGANNETGVIQPMHEVSEIVHKYGGLVHSDCIQVFGKIPLDIKKADLDMISINAHKIGGPLGAAALIYKKSLPLKGIVSGGGQEFGLRSGTHNTPAIHGFATAARQAVKTLGEYADICKELRDYLESRIAEISPETIFFGNEVERLPNTSSFTMPGVTNDVQLVHFDMAGFSVSAGAACSSGRLDLPRVHMSMGYTEEVARTSIRVSVAPSNTKEEVDKFIDSWQELFERNNFNNKKKAV